MKKENKAVTIILSSREVVARDLPHPTPLLNKDKQPYFMQKAEDSRTLRAARCTPPTSGMTMLFNNIKAFTLIELLVVVLIIGILAAVALPQYNKAVLKSRVAQVLSYLKTVKNAEEVYYLANGTYTADMEEIAVEGGLPSGWTLQLISVGTSGGTVHATMSQGSTVLIDIVTSFDHRSDKPKWAGMTYCYVPKNTIYEKVCKSYGPVLPNGDDGNYIRYQIH